MSGKCKNQHLTLDHRVVVRTTGRDKTRVDVECDYTVESSPYRFVYESDVIFHWLKSQLDRSPTVAVDNDGAEQVSHKMYHPNLNKLTLHQFTVHLMNFKLKRL